MSNSKKYKTKQKEMILSYFKDNANHHVTADDILYHLKSSGLNVGQATVYRCIKNLVEEGVVIKYSFMDGLSSCYQYIGENNEDNCIYHMICSGCGKVEHLSCGFLDKLSEHIKNEHNFNMDSSKSVIYGKCKSCMKKE